MYPKLLIIRKGTCRASWVPQNTREAVGLIRGNNLTNTGIVVVSNVIPAEINIITLTMKKINKIKRVNLLRKNDLCQFNSEKRNCPSLSMATGVHF